MNQVISGTSIICGLACLFLAEGGGPLDINSAGMQGTVFLIGALFLLIGLLGGGIEIKEIKFPECSTIIRWTCTAVGAVLMILGFRMSDTASRADTSKHGEKSSPSGPPSSPTPVSFFIHNELASDEASESVRVVIDGQSRGDLIVTKGQPPSHLRVDVDRPGMHSYYLSVDARFNMPGHVDHLIGTGQGNIIVKDGSSFDICGDITGDTYLVRLEDDKSLTREGCGS